ncbi:hypothetical protein AYI69_g4819 [Smittium culicis]|uniref:Uncharacterized protein n=1 Tax=Smittium culicis TaxID=133412 RepID=A0A1R1YAM9_9FUNG|nr:hypothetical protein AYI69_g4819 [Smittium culicis]
MLEQDASTQDPSSQDQLKQLTEITQQLLRERERDSEPEDSYLTTWVSITDATIYPKLAAAHPLTKE